MTRSQFRRDAFKELSTNGNDPYNHVGIRCGINNHWLLTRMIYGVKWRLHMWQPPKNPVAYLDDK